MNINEGDAVIRFVRVLSGDAACASPGMTRDVNTGDDMLCLRSERGGKTGEGRGKRGRGEGDDVEKRGRNEEKGKG